jgi:hypothetical protein
LVACNIATLRNEAIEARIGIDDVSWDLEFRPTKPRIGARFPEPTDAIASVRARVACGIINWFVLYLAVALVTPPPFLLYNRCRVPAVTKTVVYVDSQFALLP